MKKHIKIKYKNGSIGKIKKIVADLLPSPDKLVMKEETVKITLSLSKSSVDFFKEIAKKNNTSYQNLFLKYLKEP